MKDAKSNELNLHNSLHFGEQLQCVQKKVGLDALTGPYLLKGTFYEHETNYNVLNIPNYLNTKSLDLLNGGIYNTYAEVQ